ncbi:acyl-CoA dehydrogenase family protein [Cupriavidus consociatus]|uniref:acyl-CoA dehydrogenase family protein n=1 Tax=Cupriavidus consociatus TaxID=2821357 RepID=UPI001AE9F351|nr:MULTISPECIES: acyl-CoA dehydrogenase family protein [unclassified Cupriavidus]MBP0620595.1 acyl-CoA dehydrogenase family protein [Cupriavidus sp. LEh25]MDK2657255.1 acyl-CoA dehydrogenase family protein [Cupriavidus sp. LEh21]
MNFQLDEEHRMLKDLVARFVREQLIPLEPAVLAREAEGGQHALLPEEHARLDGLSRELGLWGLDAPTEMGGADLPVVAMVGVNEELGKTITPYDLPPDSPNLRMLMLTANDAQRERYLDSYARGETVSAIAISEPGAGGDPAMMTTRAERDGDHWVLNGRKIWISRAARADWTIVMAVTDKAKGARGGISAFIVDRGTPGLRVERRIPMIGGHSTYEVVLEDCRVPATQLLGTEGHGFAPMQARLSTRRVQMAAWCIGRAQRALDMICEYAPQRQTFGAPLAQRQAIQWWVADAATRIHACRLMTYEAASRIDAGEEARTQVSMIKVFATEMAWEVIDQAMQTFGAMGMTKELPLQQMANETRLMRIYEGPSEVHRWVIARDLLGLRR